MATRSKPSPHRRDAGSLRAWYEPRREAYPWRHQPPDPYAVFVSEVMLQQTQAPRVVPIFTSFLERFPTVAHLAAAPRDHVLRAWAGLGYHRRAVAVHEAARVMRDHHGGRVPADPDALRTLPGVGPYTASAVASIAFGLPVAVVDTNVRRITARYLRGAEPDEVAPATLAADAQSWLDASRPGDWNQALMDLGRVVCRPTPRCQDCPLIVGCRFAAAGRLGRPSVRRQPPFEGSRRQVRGRVVAALRESDPATTAGLSRATGFPAERIAEAVDGLVRDGVLEQAQRGRVRFAEG